MVLDSATHVLPGTLPARWRGIDFHMPDTSTVAGRRVVEYLFPGLNYAAYDDMGETPEEVTIDGLLLGDDYRSQAQRLRAMMKSPGPGELMHPWLGGMTVILETPGEISFSETELRVARFNMTLKVVEAGFSAGSSISTAARAQSLVASLIASALSLSQVRSPVLSRARTQRLTVKRFPKFSPVIGQEFIPSFANWLQENNEAVIVINSPVAQAAEAAQTKSQEPDARLKELSTSFESLFEEVAIAPSPTDSAQLVAAGALIMAHAVELALYIEYGSRSHAIDTRDRISANLAKLQSTVPFSVTTAAAARYQAAISQLSTHAKQLASALHDDINEAIGRLPSLHTITLDRPTDAFLVAHHLFGDTPSEVERAYRSIVKRNRMRHPAMLPAGQIEVEK